MKHRLISIALVTILLFMILGNGIGCTGGGGGASNALTVNFTAGGSVAVNGAPIPGTTMFTFAPGTVVNLTATANGGYRFVDWTATVGTLGNATAATTTYTMPSQNATVTAHFALGVLIGNVPDANQPPTVNLVTTVPTNFCAPIAMSNVLEYWDDVANHANAQNVTAGLIPETVAEYLGYFMDTNNSGSPDRVNNVGIPGTHKNDIMPGTVEFVRWDATHAYPVLPDPNAPVLPAGKLGYDWGIIVTCDTNKTTTFNFYVNEIDNGRPLVVAFDYWNPTDKAMNYTDPETGETISVFTWGGYVSSSLPPAPPEYWTYGDVGHAVTGVGYVKSWDPDGAGPIPSDDWVIVHDNWDTTPENVVIPWANWMCLYAVTP